ncbi:hypothetical protein [Hymenobacter algoricola]|uniref:DUF481 domain-containing protein n=1 Tax=Hymenobacter algoricola TaxID=486267 RepID=A0ABP7N838_9BACT
MTLHNLYPQVFSCAALSLLATSCTVYAPMQPTISTISRQGQVEISGSVQASGRVEGSVVYSPLPHVLVTGAGTFRPRLGDSTFNTTRQGELGLGGYLPLGKGWQLTGLAGYGRASTHRAYVEGTLLWGGGQTREEYTMRSGKLFGQTSLTHEGARGAVGAVYRLSKISFDQLDYAAVSYSYYASYPVPLRRMVRHEALVFGRYGLDAQNRWQLQATVGLSVAGAAEQSTTDDRRYSQANHLLLPVPITSLGVVFRPQLLGKK